MNSSTRPILKISNRRESYKNYVILYFRSFYDCVMFTFSACFCCIFMYMNYHFVNIFFYYLILVISIYIDLFSYSFLRATHFLAQICF